MTFKEGIIKLSIFIALGAVLSACGSNPAQNMSPEEIGQNLGYSSVIPVENVPAPATFTLDAVNSRTAVMGGRFGVRYLIVFGHNCPEAGFDGTYDTTATAGQLDGEDSIIIDSTYCRISEIYVLE